MVLARVINMSVFLCTRSNVRMKLVQSEII